LKKQRKLQKQETASQSVKDHGDSVATAAVVASLVAMDAAASCKTFVGVVGWLRKRRNRRWRICRRNGKTSRHRLVVATAAASAMARRVVIVSSSQQQQHQQWQDESSSSRRRNSSSNGKTSVGTFGCIRCIENLFRLHVVPKTPNNVTHCPLCCWWW
jgi:hypothetical protein